jgi:hypothetical protein
MVSFKCPLFCARAHNRIDPVIKQRMQVHKSEFRSIFTAARVIYRNEGLVAFFVSYPTTLTMTIPFTAVQFTVYEQIKHLLNPSGHYSPVTHIIAGGLAGGVAAGVTTPLDVAKTILQTRGTAQDAEMRNVGGMFDAFRVIWKRDGLRGFTRGLSPRVLTFMPSNALCWLSYEFFTEFVCWAVNRTCLNFFFFVFFFFCRGSHTREVMNDVCSTFLFCVADASQPMDVLSG